MATKRQHFVPQVYIKAWETRVESIKEPNKEFNGVYVYTKGNEIGDGRTRDSILWLPHLYTIKFNQLYMAKKCPDVFKYYVDSVYDCMINNQPAPVYGKYGYSIIKNKSSIRKHLMEIDNWDFYYENGDIAKKKAILNRINDIRCYILEDSFCELFESSWEKLRDDFIFEVTTSMPIATKQGLRYIRKGTAQDMMDFFFMMLCRSPNFNAMGVYTLIHDALRNAYGNLSEVDELMEAVWFCELYRMFYKKRGGFYHTIINKVLEKCQFILFESYNESETFITSDNPAFEHKNNVLSQNANGYIFPLTPKYLLFIVKGDEPINTIDYRYADKNTVRCFNKMILANSHSQFLGTKKQLSHLL